MRMTTRKRKNIIIAILLIMVIGMTIAYSALSSYLTINGTSNITSDFNIQITNIEFNVESSSNASDVETSGIGTTTASFKTNLQKPGSYAVYDVTVENKGNLDAYLNKLILNKPTDTNFLLTTTGISENSKLEVGIPLSFQVKIQWDSSATNIPEENITFSIELEYSQDTNYIGFPANTLLEATEKQLSLSETYNYLDGTYLKGKQQGNYVWFDGFLWRIMGKNADGSIRMITEENVTSIFSNDPNSSENYDNSYINDWLNNYFYQKLKDKDLIVKQIWCSESTTDNESVRTTCINNLSKVQQNVGLISLDEYNLSNDINGYLNNEQKFWTLTPYDSGWTWKVYNDVFWKDDFIYNAKGVRPIINIHSNIIVNAGNGTLSDPYVLGDKSNNVIGPLKDNSQIGEYVRYAGRNYRVVETSETGTKLILDGYYDSNDNGIIEESEKMLYGDNCTLCTTINSDNFINWLSGNNEVDKQKLVNTTWYRGGYWYLRDYKLNIESKENPYEGKVGLIKVGEILSGQSETILSKKHTTPNDSNNANIYWTFTLKNATVGWAINSITDTGNYEITNNYAVRPVINIGPDVQITGGNGTFNSPYQI